MTRSEAKQVANWVLNDKFAKLENWEEENGSISEYLDNAWDEFSEESKISKLLEKAYNKFTSEY